MNMIKRINGQSISYNEVARVNTEWFKTLQDLQEHNKRSNDLLDQKLIELRHDLETLRPSISDNVAKLPQVIIAAPVSDAPQLHK